MPETDKIAVSVFLIVFGYSFAFAQTDAGTRVEWLDKDGDGRNEVKITYRGEEPLRTEIDKNGDGNPDTVIDFREGVKFYAETDGDFDGRFDTWRHYDSRGALKRTERDTNGNGRRDTQTLMLQGRNLVLREYDRNHDGKVDRRALSQWGMNRRLNFPQYITLEGEQDDDYDGVIDVYRKRGVKNPDPDKTGQKMNVFFTRLTPDDGEKEDPEDGSGSGGSRKQPWLERQETMQELLQKNPNAS